MIQRELCRIVEHFMKNMKQYHENTGSFFGLKSMLIKG